MDVLFKPYFVRYIKYASILLILVFSADLLQSIIRSGVFDSLDSIGSIHITAIVLLLMFILSIGLLMIRKELYGSGLIIISGLFYLFMMSMNQTLDALDFNVEHLIGIGIVSMICFAYDKHIRNQHVELSILKHQLKHLEQSYTITKSMMEITPEMLLDDDLDKLLDRILRKAIELIPRAQSGSILIKQGDTMHFRAAVGYDLARLKKIHLRFEDMFQYKLGNLYEPAVIQEIRTFNEKNLNQEFTESGVLEESTAKAVLTCALLLNKEIYGFINLDNLDDANAFNDQDRLLIKHLAQQIEIALKNHTLVEEIYKMSQFDSLTGANSRKHHEKLVNQIFENAKFNQHPFCIAVIDVNDLKKVNDTLGHSAGDAYLEHFAHIIRNHLNEDVIFSRTGGDEFVMVFSNCEPSCAKNTIDSIRQQFKTLPFQDSQCSIEREFGCGISCYPEDGKDLATLMRLSDQRMYEDKKKRKLIA